MEVGTQQSQFAYLQAKGLADEVDEILRTHDVALWNGNDTSLSTPTTAQYFGAIVQIEAGGKIATSASTASIVDGLRNTHTHKVSKLVYQGRPTPIYGKPVVVGHIDA